MSSRGLERPSTTQAGAEEEGLGSGSREPESRQGLQDEGPQGGVRRTLEDSWAQLMDQLCTWFDEELAVDLAYVTTASDEQG